MELILWLIGIGIVCIIIYWFFFYWYITLPCIGVISLIILFVRNEKKKAEEVAAEEREKESARQQKERAQREYASAQSGILKNLTGYSQGAAAAIVKIQQSISTARQSIKQAGQEYQEGAFAPFWDAVEAAANALAGAETSIREISSFSSRYLHETRSLDSEPPPFDVRITDLPSTALAAADLKEIVRKAQKDFHFATIFEQRKTNKLLVQGFTSLNEALTHLGDRIETSIDGVISSLEDIVETSNRNHEALMENLGEMKDVMADDIAKRRTFEGRQTELFEKQLKMIDNIQRRKKPPEGILGRMTHSRTTGDTTRPHDVAADGA